VLKAMVLVVAGEKYKPKLLLCLLRLGLSGVSLLVYFGVKSEQGRRHKQGCLHILVE